MPRVVIPENRTTKAVMVAAFTYEEYALYGPDWLPKPPSFTSMNERCWLVGATILGALAVHFYVRPSK